MPLLTALIALLLVNQPVENPWIEKAPAIIARAESAAEPKALIDGLDAAWRADDWQAGRRLANKAVELKEPADPKFALRGRAARALWRAGDVRQAEQIVDRIEIGSADNVALNMAIVVEIARGNDRKAFAAADLLGKQANLTAVDLSYIVGAGFARNRFEDLVPLIRRMEKLVDPKNGYPETFLAEELEGTVEFLQKAGPKPLSTIASHGEAEMWAAPLTNLPMVTITINGKGPYNFILDTGGSILLSVDSEVAKEVGLEAMSHSTVRGVGGKDSADQALVQDLRLGDIHIQRVPARLFGVRAAAAGTADGILGTGVFGNARMVMDFMNGRVRLERSSEAPAAGEPIDLRLIGDSKWLALVTINGAPATAMLDSGADAVALAPSTLQRVFPDREHTELSAPMAGVGSSDQPKIMITGGVELKIGARAYSEFGGLGLDVLDRTLSPMLGVQLDALLGMRLFRDMKSCTMDFPRCKLWVEWLPQEN